MTTYHLPMFSQSWDSPSPDLQVCAPSPPGPSRKKSEPDAWPKMGQHLRFSWNGHGEMENLRKDFTRNFSSEHCNMGECLPSKNSYLSKMMWFSTMLVFLGRNYMQWLGFPKCGLYPRLRWCSLPKPSAPWGWGETSHEFFGNEWHYETNLVAVAESDDLSGWKDNWVCLKMGYTPNYSHLVGIMIINHWV